MMSHGELSGGPLCILLLRRWQWLCLPVKLPRRANKGRSNHTTRHVSVWIPGTTASIRPGTSSGARRGPHSALQHGFIVPERSDNGRRKPFHRVARRPLGRKTCMASERAWRCSARVFGYRACDFWFVVIELAP